MQPGPHRLHTGKTNQPLHKRTAQYRRAISSGQDSADYLHLEENRYSFEDNNVHILAREDRLFERHIKESTTLNWNNYLWPEEMAYSGTYHAPTEQHRVPSLDSLTSIHTQTPLALIIHIKWPWQLCNSEFTHDLNSSVRTHRVSNLQLLFSYSELKKPLGWEVKHLQEMENKSSCLQYST